MRQSPAIASHPYSIEDNVTYFHRNELFSIIRAGRLARRAQTALLGAVIAAALGGIATAQDAKPSGAVRQACAADVRTLCAGVLPGGGRIKKCVIEKRDQLSDGCKSAITAAWKMSGN